jgi:hypothetical protein
MQPGLMFRLQLHTDNGVNVENGNALA